MADKPLSEVFDTIRQYVAYSYRLPKERFYYGSLPAESPGVQFPCATMELQGVDFLYHTRGQYNMRVWSLDVTVYTLDDVITLFRLLDRTQERFDEQKDIVQEFKRVIRSIEIEDISTPIIEDVYVDGLRVVGITVSYRITTI